MVYGIFCTISGRTKAENGVVVYRPLDTGISREG